MFVVVNFIGEDSSFEYVPKGWLIGRDCSMWPKTSFAKMERMRSEEVDPSKTTDVEWREYTVSIISIKGNTFLLDPLHMPIRK